ncbi:MAG: dinitrogenase iron-molybdenum cofactor biosynthesis protein [Actinobacteria bacterium]|nr:dinitrogenase iron-molybdenum cofactor biosynthesis protein [Actinomycetota bacterium]
MKVVVSAQRDRMDSLVDPCFGRAPWFLIVDTETGDWEAHDNADNASARGRAGVRAGDAVTSYGAEAVITVNIGPHALKLLDAAAIRLYRARRDMHVREAVEAFDSGDLELMQTQTVSGRIGVRQSGCTMNQAATV